ncbi:hypothetical protein [Kutzneria sp. NPDC052558]|uniref:hypothetical protein n=1 Tax=Kutzneria sp. NPDC052558 TaxID=3364121 RepID=UPI0037CC52E3
MTGPIAVRHRLALGVEALDATTRTLAGSGLTAVRETPRGQVALDSDDNGRFKLRHGPGVGTNVVLRLDDPNRRFVPRRFSIPLWTLAEVLPVDQDPPTGPYIPVASRLLRPWLLPGSAYRATRGSTALRGRVVRDGGRPARWARLNALGAKGELLGWTHCDDRGEFFLLIGSAGALPPPAPDTLDVDLVVTAPATATTPDPADRLTDLVVEAAPRSPAPPSPSDLDNDLVRGLAIPPGYRASTAPRPHLTVPVGEVLAVARDVVFTS